MVKNPATVPEMGLIPGSEKSPGEKKEKSPGEGNGPWGRNESLSYSSSLFYLSMR